MKCFMCKKEFDLLNILISHFKRSHDLHNHSIIKCFECAQMFQNFNSFKRHVNRHHIMHNTIFVTKNDTEQVLFSSMSGHINKTVSKPNNADTLLNILPGLTGIGQTITSEPSTLQKVPNENTNEDTIQEPVINFNEFQKKINMSLSQFLLTLHNNNNFSRKDVTDIQKLVTSYIVEPVLNIILNFAKSKLQIMYPQIYNELFCILTEVRNPFKNIDTEYLLLKWLKENDYIDNIQQFTIDNKVTVLHNVGKLEYAEKTITGVLMPLKFQIRKMLEKDDLLKNMLTYMNSLSNDKKVKNFIQGELWKEKITLYPGKILIPYFLYLDDFEINNALGSRAGFQSICNVYYSFTCCPRVNSKLRNVFLAACIKCKDVKTLGNEKCFQYLIQELKSLEQEGIIIHSNNEKVKVHLILALVLGDNLGLNSFLNFNPSFSSNYFCRICKAHKTVTQKLSTVDLTLIRTIPNYELDIHVNRPDITGVVKNSLLNDIPSFHVVKNYYMDVMHDVFEGICHYNFSHAILYFTEQMKYFSLNTLNTRKNNFDYGIIEIKNIWSRNMELKHLYNKKFKMSAKQMMTLTFYFPLFVGDLVPSDDLVWKFLINFIELVEILLCFEVDETSINKLTFKIKKHNEDYMLLFNDTLKPKYHNLIHYPDIIRQSGPLRNIWCFKYEAKHREFKVYSHCITSRKNICLSLSKKHELKFAHQLLYCESSTNVTTNVKDLTHSNYHNIILEKLNLKDRGFQIYSRLNYRDIDYVSGNYVAIFREDIEIYKILDIVLHDNDNVLLFSQKLNDVEYEEHYIAYEVNVSNMSSFALLSIDELLGPPLNLLKIANGKNMLRVKEYYEIV